MTLFNGEASHLILSSASSAFSNGETNLEIIRLNEISSLHRKRPRSFPHNPTYHTTTVIWNKLDTASSSSQKEVSLSPTEGVQVIHMQTRIYSRRTAPRLSQPTASPNSTVVCGIYCFGYERFPKWHSCFLLGIRW